KILGLRMGKIESAHGRRRPHREAFSQGDSCVLFCGQEIEEQPFLCVVRTGRVAWRGTNPTIAFANQVLRRQTFLLAVSPLLPRTRMEPLGKGFGQAVCYCFGHYRIVVVVVALELSTYDIHPYSRRHGKGSEIIRSAG